MPSHGTGGEARGGKASAVKRVSLQLKWHHQFQFAGYYAAKELGFFEAEGIEVDLVEGGPDIDALGRMLEGDADFAVAASEVLLARMTGEETVACAVIFQHSPYVLLSRRSDQLRRPSDLIGKRVAVSEAGGAAQFRAMLIGEGIDPGKVGFTSGSWNLDDLIEGKVDAISGYSTTQAPLLRSLGCIPHKMSPVSYGVDFYGDTLCTTESFATRHREATEALTRASIRGWEYALDHPNEIIDLILTLPGVADRGTSRWQLEQEAQKMRRLIEPDVVSIGHMNRGRWENMASIYQDAGLAVVPPNPDWMDSFLLGADEESAASGLMQIGLLAGFASVSAFLVFVWNVILRKKIEKGIDMIQHQSELNRLLLESAMDAVIGLDDHDRIVRWGGRARDMFGLGASSVTGKSIERFLPGLMDRLSGESKNDLPHFQMDAVRADGEHFPAELSVSFVPGGFEVATNLFVRDIAERRELEEKLRQSQKMQAVGQLAGGVAHDFNNLLTVIQGNAALAESDADENVLPRLIEIAGAADRASDLTKQLLAFSRQQPMRMEHLCVNHCLERVARMLGRLIGEDIEITVSTPTMPVWVRADPAMLEQVLLNLAVNARDAMPQGGWLSISCDGIAPKDATGDWVRLQVKDTGGGIAPENLGHVFEPFFTTKEVGQGTGLGLATAFGIVDQHGGRMEVESEPGAGATFTVWLPGCREEADSAVRSADSNPRNSSGDETIFLVEDEAMVRTVARKVLAKHGYEVIEAENGRDALEIWKSRRDEIDLLLTDVVMPGGVGGHELATKLQSENPALPVIYTSGYSAEVFRGELVFPEAAEFLPKPYSPTDLLRMVRDSLDGVVLAG